MYKTMIYNGLYNDSSPLYIKNLQKVWKQYKDMNKHNTIIIDDTPHTYKYNYGNAIPISTYSRYDHNDDYLLQLTKWLPTLEVIRSTNKQQWYNEAILL